MSLSDNDLSNPISSKVDAHLKESNMTTPISNKVEAHQNEMNGVEMQVPEQWEERFDGNESEESSPPTLMYVEKEIRTKNKKCSLTSRLRLKSSTLKSCTSKNKDSVTENESDYYTSLQRNVSDEIKNAHNFDFGGKSKSKIKPRWSRKHQREIDFDKSMLSTWFEHGVVSKATAPRYTKNTNSENTSTCSDEYVPVQCKSTTLGDFMPNLSKLVQAENTCGQNDFEVKDEMKKPKTRSNNEVDKDIDLDIPDTQWKCKQRKLLHEKVGLCCPRYLEYPDCCASCYASHESARAHLRANAAKIIDQKNNPESIQVNNSESTDESTDAEYFQGQQRRIHLGIPLCKHGLIYLIRRFSDSLFLEAEMTLELLPRRHLHAFADAVRTLAATTENLRSSPFNDRSLICNKDYCRWKNMAFSMFEEVIDTTRGPRAPPVHNLVSFEIKLARIDSPRYRLRHLLQPEQELNEMSKYTEHFLSVKYKKALDTLDSLKARDFSKKIDRFVDLIFREVFVLMESLPTEEADALRKSIAAFNDVTWRMRDLEERSAGEKENPCCGLFRSRKSSKIEVSSNLDSDFSLNDETDNGQVSHKTLSSKASKPEMKDKSTQVSFLQDSQTVTTNLDAFSKQSSSTVKEICFSPPRQLSPTVMVERTSRDWESISDDYESDYEIREPTPEEVEAIRDRTVELVLARVKQLASEKDEAKNNSIPLFEPSVIEGDVSPQNETKTETQDLKMVLPQTTSENVVLRGLSASNETNEAEKQISQ